LMGMTDGLWQIPTSITESCDALERRGSWAWGGTMRWRCGAAIRINRLRVCMSCRRPCLVGKRQGKKARIQGSMLESGAQTAMLVCYLHEGVPSVEPLVEPIVFKRGRKTLATRCAWIVQLVSSSLVEFQLSMAD
jgi:hypothetical protein